jgi:DNA-binding FadR family transcriptional regulator
VTDEPTHADRLADELRGEILSGRYRPVNRLSAREALQQLERLGLVEIKKGGARVAALHDASPDVIAHLFDAGGALDPALVEQWLDVSELLFTGAVRLALERASDAELERARELLRRLVRAGTAGEDATYFAALDELGELIFAGSRNLVLRLIRNGLRANVLPRLEGKRGRLRPVRAELSELVRAIDDAVAARDPERGQEAVRLLLRANRERILKSLRKEIR